MVAPRLTINGGMMMGKSALVLAAVLGLTGFGLAGTAHAASGFDSTYRWGAYQNNNQQSPTPVAVGNLKNITAIAAGNLSDMALDSSGNVWTWGRANNGVLGNGQRHGYRAKAVEVTGLPPIVSIGESMNTDVAIDASGNVWGWGWNLGGQLCTGNTHEFARPVELTALSGVVAAAGGYLHMIYLLSNGTVEMCGANTHGVLGDGSFASSSTPVTVSGLPATVKAVSSGQGSATVLLTNGQVWDWGYNKFGELGNGTETNSDVPVQAELPSAAVEVSTGGSTPSNGQSLALLANGQVWGWGCNSSGQLGDGTTKRGDSVPVQATALPSGTYTDVISGGAQSLALQPNGNVWAWGLDVDGEVGDGGNNTAVLTPVKVLTGADMISATAADSVAHVP